MYFQQNQEKASFLSPLSRKISSIQTSLHREQSNRTQIIDMKQKALSSIEDFKVYIQGQNNNSKFFQPLQTKQAVTSSDYPNMTTSNLPKIQIILQQKNHSFGNPIKLTDKRQYKDQRLQNTQTYQKATASDLDFQSQNSLSQTLQRQPQTKSSQRECAVGPTQSNFYSTFNFNVMHSKSTHLKDDKVHEDQQQIAQQLGQQFGGIHRAGGTQFKNWSIQTTHQKDKPRRYDEFKASRYRSIGGSQPNDAGEFIVESDSQFRLERFESIMESKGIDSPSDFNFKRKVKKQDQKQNQSFDEFGSIFQSKPYNSTQHTSLLQKSINERQSIQVVESKLNSCTNQELAALVAFEISQQTSSNVSSYQINYEIPKKIKNYFAKKINEQKPVKPQLLQQILKKPNKLQACSQVNKMISREERLRNRPMYNRPSSALARSHFVQSKLIKQGCDISHHLYDDKSLLKDDQISTERASEQLDRSEFLPYNQQRLLNYSTQQFNGNLSRATLPRLTALSMRIESKNFKIQLANQQFNHIFNRCSTSQDRRMINDAYEHFHDEVSHQILKQKPLKKIKVATEHSTSDSSSEIGSQIGDMIGKFSESATYGKIMKSLNRKLIQYRRGLQGKLDIINYHHLAENLDFDEIAKQQQETGRIRRKQMPIQGEDLEIAALARIYTHQDKLDKKNLDEKKRLNIEAYTNLLQQDKIEGEFYGMPQEMLKSQKKIPKFNRLDSGQKQAGRIKRGFLLFPNSMDLNNVDFEEEIDDPELMFDKYIQRINIDKEEAGNDFMRRFEDQRVSGIYNFNSTIYENNPTARVAFFTHCKRQMSLALPILSKIKNGELVLNDYTLNNGHYEALIASFTIQPEILTKITLNNCGIDDQSATSLFKALQKLSKIEYIQISKGDLGQLAIQELKPLLTNSGGQNLTVLKLKDVKMQASHAESLFKILANRSYLKTLSLVNFNFTERSFALFTEYFAVNPCLQHLDISYARGIRPPNYVKFMEVLSQNKTLHSLDISWNNFIEDQPAAFTQLQNPYKVFKAMYARWIALGPGARWPGKPDPKATGAPPKQIIQRKQSKQIPQGGRVQVQVPEFDVYDKTNEIPDRTNQDQTLDGTSKEDQEQQKTTENEVTRLVKACLLFAFQQRLKISIPKLDVTKSQENIKKENPFKPQEEVSTLAMVATEAIYKFIRRNQKLQHLNISRCNLTQVMIGRIGLGIKCSKTVMGVHFSDNPGVTPALKAFLQLKMRAAPPQKQHDTINNFFIEKDSQLQEKLHQQIVTNEAAVSLAHETILLKEQVKKNVDVMMPSDPSAAVNKQLVFTRLLGHKLQIPNSGRWKISTNPSHECWICKKHIVSLIFWSPKQIADHQVPDSFINKEKIQNQLSKDYEAGNPFIFGSFTNWAPVKMRSVKEFAQLYTSLTTPNFFPFFTKKLNLGPGYDSFKDLKTEHKILFKELQTAYEMDPEINWRRHIASMLKFQESCMLNYENLSQSEFTLKNKDGIFNDLISNPIFVHAALLKPGKQHYMIQHNTELNQLPRMNSRSHESFNSSQCDFSSQKQSQQSQQNVEDLMQHEGIETQRQLKKLHTDFYLHRSIIPQRVEQIPLLQKKVVEQVVIRQFIHRQSVFAPWQPDNSSILTRCVENDWLAMNLSKFIKNDDEIASLLKIINKHISYLKEVHIELISDSDIAPFVSFLDFVNFAQHCKLIQDGMKQASLELIYVQVDTNNKFRNGIIRGEFIEALIRIAKAKYIDTGVEKKFDVALDMLIEQFIKPNWVAEKWKSLRDKKFWNNEINDILQANLGNLLRIHQKFYDLKRLPKKKFMEMKECEYLVTETKLRVNIKSVKRAYILSKMTCSDEQNKIDTYNKQQFVEFLEFLCRLALDLEDDNLGKSTITHLQRRLEVVLDHILSYIDCMRKDVVVEALMDSDADLSDCDY